MQKVLTDKSLSQVAILFRYFLFEALKKSGLGDSIPSEFKPWYNMMDLGLTTFTEFPPDWPGQRSDCHPWAASPNIEFYTGLLGLKPLLPGYEKISIEPSFGNLKILSGKVPLKMGILQFDLKKTGDSAVRGVINLPHGISGQFIFNGKQVNLVSGENKLDL